MEREWVKGFLIKICLICLIAINMPAIGSAGDDDKGDSKAVAVAEYSLNGASDAKDKKITSQESSNKVVLKVNRSDDDIAVLKKTDSQNATKVVFIPAEPEYFIDGQPRVLSRWSAGGSLLVGLQAATACDSASGSLKIPCGTSLYTGSGVNYRYRNSPDVTFFNTGDIAPVLKEAYRCGKVKPLELANFMIGHGWEACGLLVSGFPNPKNAWGIEFLAASQTLGPNGVPNNVYAVGFAYGPEGYHQVFNQTLWYDQSDRPLAAPPACLVPAGITGNRQGV